MSICRSTRARWCRPSTTALLAWWSTRITYNRPAQPRDTTLVEHVDPNFLPDPQFWVDEKEIEWPGESRTGPFGFKDITAATDSRTIIASDHPEGSAFGNKVTLRLFCQSLAPSTKRRAVRTMPCESRCFGLAYANLQQSHVRLTSWPARKSKAHTLNLVRILEQLPVIPPDAYHRRFGDRTAADLIRHHVLRLTYTSHDMAPFARDLGHHGPPFPWDPEQRRHLRARLDALYFHLYGLDRDDASYILSTFPIIQRQDEAQFDGRTAPADLILAYMNALAAGDTESQMAV